MESMWSEKRVRSVAANAIGAPDSVELLSQHDNRRVVRCQSDEGPFILKLWARPDLQTRLRRLWKAASVHREWDGLVRAHALGVRVPEPLALATLGGVAGEYTDAIAMGDLGPHEIAIEHLKELYKADSEADAVLFEQELIEMTATLIEGGLLDADHGLVNIIATEGGQPARIDLELARCFRDPWRQTSRVAVMIGHLFATHTFSVQPHTELTRRFATRFLERLPLDEALLGQVAVYVQSRLDLQENADGIVTAIDLPWLRPAA